MANIPVPNTRKEQLLYAAATGDKNNLPVPNTREEEYLHAIATKPSGGGGGDIDVTKTTISALGSAGSLPQWTFSGNKATFNAGALPSGSSVTVVTDVQSV